MSLFNRSIQDRFFAAFLSLVLMVPTGWGLKMYFTLDHSHDSPDFLARLFLHVGMEIVGIAFAFSVLGVIWAVFTPAWIDRTVRFAVDHFVLALAGLLCVILGMFGFVWFTMHHT
jgi:ABC-type phosphate transport system permease subunit